jgi:hypothetical protein
MEDLVSGACVEVTFGFWLSVLGISVVGLINDSIETALPVDEETADVTLCSSVYKERITTSDVVDNAAEVALLSDVLAELCNAVVTAFVEPMSKPQCPVSSESVTGTLSQ